MSENETNPIPGDNPDVVDAFEAGVGDISSPDGRTTLRVDREGQYLVAHEWIEEQASDLSETEDQEGKDKDGEQGEQREETRGDVRKFGVEPEQLFELVGSVPARDDFPSRPGLPDEPILTLTVESASGAQVQRMWLRDAEQEFDDLIVPLRTIVEGATDGRRYL